MILLLTAIGIGLSLPTASSADPQASPAVADSNNERSLEQASDSITARKLKQHIEFLASDTLEGREAGTHGNYASASYIVNELRQAGLNGPLDDHGHLQYFAPNFRNILAVLPGSDASLRDEFVLVGAHYDHVGYGNSSNSRGPIGVVHNGADDNASGTAGLLEVSRAIATLAPPPRRSILFVFWDAEEKGLLGSRFFVSAPAVPLNRIRLTINVDMIGRLRHGEFEMYGWRTAPGLRQFIVKHGDAAFPMTFTWSYRPDSDHWPFFDRGVPSLMLHTGKHDDYHRPTDDSHLINFDGTADVTKLLLRLTLAAANTDTLPPFRRDSLAEATQPEPQFSDTRRPSRLGITYDGDLAAERRVVVKGVATSSAANRGGIRPGDEILSVGGRLVSDLEDFRTLVNAAHNPVAVEITRDSMPMTLTFDFNGEPDDFGLHVREDSAEPDTLIVTTVQPASAAQLAGLQPGHRILSLDGQPVSTTADLDARLTRVTESISLAVERSGILQTLTLNRIFPLPTDSE